MQKILITTGGTGGHIIPAQIIKEYLDEDYEVYYSTDYRGKKYKQVYKENMSIKGG